MVARRAVGAERSVVGLSIVYAVRDPDYAGGLRHRMQVSLDTLDVLARECGLDYELIVVEWNPPPGKPTVRESISCPPTADGRLRFIEVPPSVHTELGAPPELPFLEYVAKNVAIRRARGEWVLATTPDVLFNEPLIRFLARAPLSHDSFYRIDRHDVSAAIPVGVPWTLALELCERSVFVAHEAEGSRPVPPVDVAPDLLPGPLPAPSCRVAPTTLHTNASGDFFLTSRRNWFELRGYAQILTHAHIDSIMCWTAVSSGLTQVILADGMRLYHQDHDRSAHETFPLTDWSVWRGRFQDAVARGERLVVNDDDWGLAARTFDEHPGGGFARHRSAR